MDRKFPRASYLDKEGRAYFSHTGGYHEIAAQYDETAQQMMASGDRLSAQKTLCLPGDGATRTVKKLFAVLDQL
ncbi:MAG: hypothetical protein JWM96_12 [Alphaproteobacteria bacterium]|nr:hypothetical protein [Alphaproteobacteria bacterium]